MISLKKFEDIIGYTFKNKALLSTALTHSSYANEKHCKSYERLEFLGDSVLSLIVSRYFFQKMSYVNEGDLSRIRASLVCESTLSSVARKIRIGDFLLLGNGEEKAGSRNRDSILADVFEATLAAMYLDSDLAQVEKFLFTVMSDELSNALQGKALKDFKTQLQEYVQHKTHGKSKILYTTVNESGPDHRKKFVVELSIDGEYISDGESGTKKDAEQEAARKALALMNV